MKILLADDQLTLATALHTRLEQLPKFQLVGVAKNAQQLAICVQRHVPDILLLDCELPGLRDDSDRCALLHKLQQEHRQMRIIALSSRIEARQKALSAGVHAFVSKSDSPDYLFAVLQTMQNPQVGR
jgi:DNA-binding NarL/FixJ family response regulator